MTTTKSTAKSNSSKVRQLTRCPVCGGQNSRRLIDRQNVPVFCNVLATSRDEALNTERGRLCLQFCSDCDMIYNSAFDPELLNYTGEYENAQHYSPRFRRYLVDLATTLVTRYGLARKDIVEIGCGDGRFLAMLCEAGKNRGVGFDPAARQISSDASEVSISIVPELYSEKHANVPADFVCCRHVLEHVAQPRKFLTSIRRTLADRTDSFVYFEVPNALSTLQDFGFWDLLYEHHLYFTEPALSTLFSDCGFNVQCIWESFGRQFLSLIAKPATGQPSRWNAEQTRKLLADQLIGRFESHYTHKVQMWEERLDHEFKQNQTVAVWGAGTKGVMFLNSVPGCERVEYVVDVNPRKKGCFVAGSGQKIVSPSELSQVKPDVVVAMNPMYVDEIRTELKRAGLKTRIQLV